jgi:hypothetical protein
MRSEADSASLLLAQETIFVPKDGHGITVVKLWYIANDWSIVAYIQNILNFFFGKTRSSERTIILQMTEPPMPVLYVVKAPVKAPVFQKNGKF